MSTTTNSCLFCRRDDAAANTVVAENVTCYARLDNYPVSPGHLEIVPKRHVESYFDLTFTEVLDMHALLGTVRGSSANGQAPDGYTIGVNEGRAAGRTIDHVHLHLIPRHVGDVPDPRGGVRNVVPGRYTPDDWAARIEQRDEGAAYASLTAAEALEWKRQNPEGAL